VDATDLLNSCPINNFVNEPQNNDKTDLTSPPPSPDPEVEVLVSRPVTRSGRVV